MTNTETTQLHQRPTDDRQLRLPGARIENTNLRDLVLAAVRQLDPRLLIPGTAAEAGIACQPRVLLGLLTYCYASGVFSSQEIEARVRKDPILILLCGQELPDWHLIRRFRRYNRDLIQHCLEVTLYRANAASGPRASVGPEGNDPVVSAARSSDAVDRGQCGEDAGERIRWAINLDHMFLDE
ncbi:MAG: hypothetical protein DME22_22870 [Verrucomicrobia bacterium]|nr:MAG: hypothetical protein DME22_22870 [Verrucomicrobiota bacterium]PYK03242.1 MAG: hypothetical protein DME23_00145 [Verrucomicrobiota bacterium]